MPANSHFLYISTVLIWGSSWFAVKLQLGEVDEAASLVYRFALAAVLLLIFCLITRRSLRFTASQHLFIALQGIFLFASNYLVIYWATHLLSSGLIAVAFSTIIFMNITGAAIAFKQKLQLRVLGGATIGLAGIVLIFWPEFESFDVHSPAATGLGLALLGTLLASIGNLFSARNQRHGIPVVQTNAWGMGYGALVMCIYALLAGTEFSFDTSLVYTGSLLYLVVFASILAFGGYLTLLGRIGADRAAYAMVLFPVVALAISTAFEGYQWTLLAVIGLSLVMFGNVMVLRIPNQT
ncbi:MAG: EamA family transporter [Pseudomonadota bacterium]